MSEFFTTITKRKSGYVVTLDGKVITEVVPDKTYPGMYRVLADGQLSDMVNISRATDTALVLAQSILNRNPASG